MKQKILFFGGAHSDIPQIIVAKKLGMYVITSGNNPDEIGHFYSDEYHAEDFSNKIKMLDLVKSLDVNYICPSCNDFSIISAAYVAGILKYPGFDALETVQIIHHKDLFRKFLIQNNIPSPKAESSESIEHALTLLGKHNFPLMIKPVDLTGGKGISLSINIQDAKKKIPLAFKLSKEKRIVIEQYIKGSRHGLTSLISNKKVVFYFNDDEHYYLNNFLVSGTSSPSKVSIKIISELCSYIEKIANILNLCDGIFHIQYILNKNKPFIIEACRRPPGDLYPEFVKHSTTLNYSKLILAPYVGLSIDIKNQKNKINFISRHCIMPRKNGVILDLRISPKIKSKITNSIFWWKQGDIISNFMTHKFGIIFMKFRSNDEMDFFNKNLYKYIKIKYK